MTVTKYFPALLSGLLLTLSFPKADFSWFAWIALTPLMVSLKGMDGKSAFYAGFTTGGLHFLSLLYWIVPTISTYGQLPMVLAVPVLMLLSFYLALYPALFAFGVNSFYNIFMPVTAAAMWVSLEYIRSTLFTGFPWGLVGCSQYMNLTLIQIADITSVYGISFVIVMANGVISMTMRPTPEKSGGVGSVLKTGFRSCIIWYVCLIAVVASLFIYGKVRISQIEEKEQQSGRLTLSVVQGNVGQLVKWDKIYQESIIDKYCELSMEAISRKPDLIVWPETSMPFYYEWNKELSARVDQCIKNAETSFLIGSPAFEVIHGPQEAGEENSEKEKAGGSDTGERVENSFKIYNRAYMVNPRWGISGRYDKIHLVPFGEYVPLGEYISFLGKIVAQSGDFSPGARDVPPLSFSGSTAGVLICFEIIFPYLSREAVNNGAQILVNTTNDAWFGETSAPEQHFSMAVFRAIENRRAVARAANTGISGFIQPTGNIAGVSDLYVDTVLTRSLPTLTMQTFYSAWGDLFAMICLVAMALLCMINIVKSRCVKKAGECFENTVY